jgi:hypothetical protein
LAYRPPNLSKSKEISCSGITRPSFFDSIERFVSIRPDEAAKSEVMGGCSPQSFELLDIDAASPFFKFFETEKLSSAGPRAGFTDFIPLLLGFQIGLPERPGPALAGTYWIHCAFAFSCLKKCAVAILVFGQRDAVADGSRMEQTDFADWLLQVVRDFL